MYNMDISIFGYKLKLEILILIGLICLILFGHTLLGSSSMMEGLDNMEKQTMEETDNKISSSEFEENPEVNAEEPAPAAITANAKNGASKMKGKVTESFVGANTNYGQSSPYDLATQTVVDTASWSAPDMTVVPGKPLSDGVKQFLARKQQQLPLPEGQMDFFANSEFKPECCPNTYSNSSGCWCGTSQDYNYLITRAGNNVPYSQY
jgi:hypothetical protein